MKIYKKIMLKYIALLIVLAGSVSCSMKGDNEMFNDPKEILFAEYFLNETGCWWTNFESGKVIIINNNNELEKHIACSDSSNGYPAIDFSKQTLLLVSGGATNGVSKIDTKFTQTAINKYVLRVIIHENITTVPQGWNISILTSKIGNKGNVTLNVEQTYQ